LGNFFRPPGLYLPQSKGVFGGGPRKVLILGGKGREFTLGLPKRLLLAGNLVLFKILWGISTEKPFCP